MIQTINTPSRAKSFHEEFDEHTRQKHIAEERTDDAIKQRLAECSYGFIFNHVTWRYEKGVVTLQGKVPNFYLRGVLKRLVSDLENVQQVVNDVHVVSSTGLSSVADSDEK